jgi:hypothetical protein
MLPFTSGLCPSSVREGVEERQEEALHLAAHWGEEKKGRWVLFSLFSPTLPTLGRRKRA